MIRRSVTAVMVVDKLTSVDGVLIELVRRRQVESRHLQRAVLRRVNDDVAYNCVDIDVVQSSLQWRHVERRLADDDLGALLYSGRAERHQPVDVVVVDMLV